MPHVAGMSAKTAPGELPGRRLPPLDVLVPGGRDLPMDFGRGIPRDCPHPPVSFHAMAAATGGAFHNDPGGVTDDRRPVLLLIPGRASRALEAGNLLRARGHPVLVTWKECGTRQIQKAWRRPGYPGTMARIGELASAWIAASPGAGRVLASWMPDARTVILPTPYPVDVPGWTSSLSPPSDRKGVFIGTREWGVSFRRHRESVMLAARLAARFPGMPVTAVNRDGLSGVVRTALAARGRVKLVPPMGYGPYLQTMAAHRVVLQRDIGGVPGQVAGDSLLAGLPCLGGNGMVDRLAYPHLPGGGASPEEVFECAARLLSDDCYWEETVRTARENALGKISFAAFRKRWARTLEILYSV